MMKMRMLLSILFIMLPLLSWSQTSAADRTYPYISPEGFLYLTQYDIYRIGERVTLGKGTLPDGSFMYINKTMAKIPLEGTYSGKQAEVQWVKSMAGKRRDIKGNIFYAAIKGEGFKNYEVDLNNALASGEIISKDPNFKPMVNRSIGIADEIRKYKELLDSGAITLEEYEKLKRKLIY